MNRRNYPAPPGRGHVTPRALLERRVVQIPDVSADPEYALNAMATTGGYRSAAAVPIMRDGSPIGVIAVTRAQTGLLPERQIQLLKTFADQAVIAIENTRLFEAEQTSKRELQESLEYQTAISNVLDVISRSPNQLQPVLDTIVRTAQRLPSPTEPSSSAWGTANIASPPGMGPNPEPIRHLETDPPISTDPGSGRRSGQSRARAPHDRRARCRRGPELATGDLNRSGRGRSVLAVPLIRDNAGHGCHHRRLRRRPSVHRQANRTH